MSQEKRSGPAGAGSSKSPILHRYDPRQPAVAPVLPVAPAAPAGEPRSSAGQPQSADALSPEAPPAAESRTGQPDRPVEIGGPSGPEPTRYGDWERNGRVSDF